MGWIKPLEWMPTQTGWVLSQRRGRAIERPSNGLSRRQLTTTGVGGSTKQLERLKMTITGCLGRMQADV